MLLRSAHPDRRVAETRIGDAFVQRHSPAVQEEVGESVVVVVTGAQFSITVLRQQTVDLGDPVGQALLRPMALPLVAEQRAEVRAVAHVLGEQRQCRIAAAALVGVPMLSDTQPRVAQMQGSETRASAGCFSIQYASTTPSNRARESMPT